jgi:5-hydroxyisourate hydrolase
MSRATISTHVLDLSTGKPGADIGVTLATADGTLVGEGRTGEDGRIAQLTPDGVAPGEYQLLFELEDYFVDRPHLFQVVTLEVLIDEERPYHIPLLLSPFGISSYRGS